MTSLNKDHMAQDGIINDVVEASCRIPSEFYRRGNVSFWDLVKESGYQRQQAAIGIEDVKRCRRAHPELIGVWQQYSEDKRVSSGWYFDKANQEVGYYSDRREHVQTFGDNFEACAVFIKYELDSTCTGMA